MRRFRFRFGLRSLLIAVAILGCLFAWLGRSALQQRQEQAAAAMFQRLGGHVDYQITRWPRWLHGAFGRWPVVTVNLAGSSVSDDDLVHLSKICHVRSLILADTAVTDDGLTHLQSLTGLESLSVAGTRIADAGLLHLAGLSDLRLLELRHTQVTDAGLAHLQGMQRLEILGLADTNIDDAGLQQLETLKALRRVLVGGTKVTETEATDFERAMPGCEVRR